MKTEKDFVKELKTYIPTGCRADEGTDFNLKKVHWMIDEYLKE